MICDLSRKNVPYGIRWNNWTHGKQTVKKRMQIFFERQGWAAERMQIFSNGKVERLEGCNFFSNG